MVQHTTQAEKAGSAAATTTQKAAATTALANACSTQTAMFQLPLRRWCQTTRLDYIPCTSIICFPRLTLLLLLLLLPLPLPLPLLLLLLLHTERSRSHQSPPPHLAAEHGTKA
jgi:hypothetical protein